MADGAPNQRHGAPVVLLIEDSVVVRERIAEAFERAGMTVEQTSLCEEALRKARLARPNVLVVDRELPDGDGWRFVAELRRVSGGDGVVAIALTAHAKLKSAERAFVEGCEAFVEVPCDPEIVVQHAKRLLSLREATTSVRRKLLRDS